MNAAQIKAFLENPHINPLTQRRIVPGKATYNALMEMVRAKQEPIAVQQTKQKPTTVEHPRQPKQRRVLIMVLGLGCSRLSPEAIEKNRASLAKYLKNAMDEVVLMCNQSLASTVYDIAQTYCSFRPGLNNTFVKEVVEEVKKHLDMGHQVYLLGHSYGGSVAARVAESFVKHATLENASSLSVATFGSIYVPKKARVAGIDITHYMYVNDVALKCNGLNHKVPQPDKSVTWLRYSDYKTPVKKEFTFLGTSEEWDVHNDYNETMMTFIRTKLQRRKEM